VVDDDELVEVDDDELVDEDVVETVVVVPK